MTIICFTYVQVYKKNLFRYASLHGEHSIYSRFLSRT